MTPPEKKSARKLATNKSAFRDYFILERLEAGIELRGTEVKSVKGGHVSLQSGFASIENDEAILYDVNIPPYDFGNRFNHKPDRPRRLLLHRNEIRRFRAQIDQKGLSLIPLSLYLKKGIVKVEIAVCKGKRFADKREALKRKTADREAARAMTSVRRRP